MGISDRIESFITELLKDEDNWVEIGRNELAGIFNCVPSQINYVISTRFSPEKGYYVESRRGGGGYIRIKKIEKDLLGDINLIINNIGSIITSEKAEDIIDYLYKTDRLTEQIKEIAKAAVSPESLSGLENEDSVRARILKNILKKAL